MARDRGQHGKLAALVCALLLIASSHALLQLSREIEGPDVIPAANGNLELVRAYYANLNAFLHGGDIEPVLDLFTVVAVESRPLDGESPPSVDLRTKLVALRSTYPKLTYVIARTESAGQVVSAEVELWHSQASIPSWMVFSGQVERKLSLDTFRLEDGQIAEHWASVDWPLVHPLSDRRTSVKVMRESTLAISELSLSPLQRTFVRLPGPAVLLITAGTLEVATDVTIQFAASLGEEWARGSSSETRTFAAGSVVTSSAGGLNVRNSFNTTATALLITLAINWTTEDMLKQALESPFAHREKYFVADFGLVPALSDANLDVEGTATELPRLIMTTLAHEGTRVPIGTGVLEVDLILLPAGMTGTFDGGTALIAHPIGSTGSQLTVSSNGNQHTVSNESSESRAVLLARYSDFDE